MSQSKDGYFRASFYYRGRKYVKTGKTQREADKKAALELDKLERGLVGINGKMTVDRWAHEWLETYKRPAIGFKQYEMYKHMIDDILAPAIGKLRLVDVTDAHLQRIMNSAEGMSSSHAHKLKYTIGAMFKTARASRLINHNPAEVLTTPKTTEGTHRCLTEYEREHFMKASASHDSGLMFRVMLLCGLRTGEVVALEWRDIDFEKRRISVSRAIESGTGEVKSPKTVAGKREIPIPDELYDALAEIRGEPFAPVFTQRRGKVRHTESSRRKAWESLKNQMDLSMGAVLEKRKAADGKIRTVKVLSVVAPDLVPYCLRHTYCTDLQDAGVPINVAKYLMGHSNIQVTAKIYTDTTDKVIDAAAEAVKNAGMVKNMVKTETQTTRKG